MILSFECVIFLFFCFLNTPRVIHYIHDDKSHMYIKQCRSLYYASNRMIIYDNLSFMKKITNTEILKTL